MSTIRNIRNIAADSSIELPSRWNRIEMAAAVFANFHDNHGTYPDRHQFIVAAPIFGKSLPSNPDEAAVIVASAAARLLGVAGIASDAVRLADARGVLEAAKLEAAAAEHARGARMSKIQSLENRLTEERRCLEKWNIDFVGEAEKADRLIVENWGHTTVVSPFDTLAMLAVLKRLAPTAIKEIAGRIKALESELADLKLA